MLSVHWDVCPCFLYNKISVYALCTLRFLSMLYVHWEVCLGCIYTEVSTHAVCTLRIMLYPKIYVCAVCTLSCLSMLCVHWDISTCCLYTEIAYHDVCKLKFPYGLILIWCHSKVILSFHWYFPVSCDSPVSSFGSPAHLHGPLNSEQ